MNPQLTDALKLRQAEADAAAVKAVDHANALTRELLRATARFELGSRAARLHLELIEEDHTAWFGAIHVTFLDGSTLDLTNPQSEFEEKIAEILDHLAADLWTGAELSGVSSLTLDLQPGLRADDDETGV